MKQFIILFYFFVKVFGYDEAIEGCKPWPSNVRSVRECCDIPHLSSTQIQDVCTEVCILMKDDDKDCPINCYLNQTMLIKNGTIDKASVKSILKKNVDFYWRYLAHEGVDKCEYVTSDSVTQSLAKFYDCISDHMTNNCVKFRNSPGCKKTEELFEKCKYVNCTEWPYNLPSPQDCCNTPEVFNEAFDRKCDFECRQKEFFLSSQDDCFDNCMIDKIKTDDKIDFQLVKKFLIENSNKSEAWEKPIANAIGKCEEFVSDAKKIEELQGVSDHMLVVGMLRYLRFVLSEDCVDIVSDENICKNVKNFVTRCPDTKPNSSPA